LLLLLVMCLVDFFSLGRVVV